LQSQGKLYVVGIGPGSLEMLTSKAIKAIEESKYVVGYKSYVERISSLLEGKEVITTQMREEIERVEIAVNLAKKSVVSLISGGDPSVYGILPLVIEYVVKNGIDVEIEVIPGVTAFSVASALLGSPVSGDCAILSLSDLLVPWNVIERRLIHALAGDFVIAIYNPSSTRRLENLRRAMDIIMKYRGDVFVGVVRNATREGQRVEIVRISQLKDVDMNTILIVGNSETRVGEWRGRTVLYTPRGYSNKYSLSSERMGAKTDKAKEVAMKSEEVLRSFHPGDGLRDEIVRRCIATTGDVAVKEIIRFVGDPEEGVKAVKDGCRIITDVHMVRAGIRRAAIAAVDFGDDTETRTASGIRRLGELIEGSLIAIGNSPSAAMALCEVAERYQPRFVVATPVGFVNASESKEMVRRLGVPSITTEGTKGGSGICAAIVNCLIEYAERPD